MSPLDYMQGARREIMPPTLEAKTGPLQAALPDFGRVAVLVAGDAVKEAAIGISQRAQASFIQAIADG